MPVYYNEIDPYAAQWLRNLIAEDHLPHGDVDERSIADVRASDVAGYDQCHFFAGIGGWPLALRLAGWPDNRPAWTGSCPCQPFSTAGQRKGYADERDLWPYFYMLILECRPAIVFGEQVAGKGGREWLAGVRADLEASGYAFGAAGLCAAGVGAPHIRQRLFWVAHADTTRSQRRREHPGERADERPAGARSATGRLGDATSARRHEQPRWDVEPGRWTAGEPGRYGNGEFWSGTVWLPCLDGKARRVKPLVFPLAHGVPGRVGRLRAAGNAIVPQVAAEFITAFMECTP